MLKRAKEVNLNLNLKNKIINENKTSYLKANFSLELIQKYQEMEEIEDNLKEYILVAKEYYPAIIDNIQYIENEINRIDELQDNAIKIIKNNFMKISEDNFETFKYLDNSKEKIKIFKLVEENCDTIANSFLISKMMNLHLMAEEIEDDLKEYLKRKIDYEENKVHKSIFKYIKKEIDYIDNAQDKYFIQIQALLLQIFSENRNSNKILKFFDVKGNYRKLKILRSKKNKEDIDLKISLFNDLKEMN
jgi:phage regulator Rha-like protein